MITALCICGMENCSIPFGLCHCGCGRRTTICDRDYELRKARRGMPRCYCAHHAGTPRNGDLSLAHPFKLNGAYCKLIPLTRGLFTIVNEEDYQRLAAHLWYALKARNTYYAARTDKSEARGILMHREILGPSVSACVDHRDMNGLNNTRLNLRQATAAQNAGNQPSRRNTQSPYKGVSFHAARSRWIMQIKCSGKGYYAKYCDSEVEAALEYDVRAVELFGPFARLNFPERIVYENQ